MLKPRLMPIITICTLSLFLVATTGCYGKFQLTRTLYKLNGSVEDKVARSIVTAVMIVFPVYWFGAAVDWILFNTIEFWTGKNPMTEQVITIPRVENEEMNAVQTSRRTSEGLETVVQIYRQGRPAGTLTLRQNYGSADLFTQMAWPNGAIERHRIHTDRLSSPTS
ncbi:MAG: DUF3332 family protein [Nitrospirota bacterium]